MIAGGIIYLVGASDVSSAKNNCPNGRVPRRRDTASANQGNTGDNLEKAGAVTFYVGLGSRGRRRPLALPRADGPAPPEPRPRALSRRRRRPASRGELVGSF